MKLPNFLVIGAAKSGTISLYHYLNQHPQIYMSPILEPKFFAFADGEKPSFKGPGDIKANSHIITDLESYSRLFERSDNKLAIGESSPSYLYYEGIPERIQKILPNVKIIAILRHPVERAYSNYLHLFSSGREPISSFQQALHAEQKRISNNWEYFWHYKHQGFYYQHLKRYFSVFDRNQIKIYLYEDYKSDPTIILQDMFRFLNVDNTFLPDFSEKHNVTNFVKSKTIFRFMTQPNPINLILKALIPSGMRSRIVSSVRNKIITHEKPELSLDLKEYLLNEYYEDILNLQDLIQKDLSNWLDISNIHY